MTKRITPDLLLQHLQDECYAGRMTIVQALWFEDAAQVWAAERREIDTLRQNWQRCTEYAARLEEERDELRRENEKWGALCDIEYTSGAKFGWNCAVADDDERFERVCRDRNRGALQELKRLKPKGEWLPAPDTKPPEAGDE